MFEKNFVLDEIQCENLEMSIKNYVSHFSKVWHSCSSITPGLGNIYSSKDKVDRENDINKFLNTIKKESKKNGYSFSDQLRNSEKYSPAIRSFLKDGLGFKNDEIDILFSNDFLKITASFIKAAKDFDSSITTQDIFQALRNVWTMNWIQFLLNRPVEFTPSVFAYSMLYPYTDNYLDNPGIEQDDKLNFSRRLSERLLGNRVEPSNLHEQNIYNLINIIESQYDRIIYPGVYESLFAIHFAQIKSLELLNPMNELACEELLNTSLEKGGTSVLADGYLVAGNLTEEQKIFLFGYGAYLQLIDDLQDVHDDFNHKFRTVFSNPTNRFPLDELASRMHNFGEKILSGYNIIVRKNINALEIMKRSNILMMIGAVAITEDLYSASFVKRTEEYSPFHFSYLKKLQEDFRNNEFLFMNFTR